MAKRRDPLLQMCPLQRHPIPDSARTARILESIFQVRLCTTELDV